MTEPEIVHLDQVRGRRAARLKRTLALHAHDPARTRILGQLSQALTVLGGDRAVVLWLDEY
ncbi:hypothetical protein ACFL3S_12495, partial [Gemmatimonadota bacterium]